MTLASAMTMFAVKSYTIPQLALRSGYKAEYIRQACHRASWNNPLPHVKSGFKRPVIYIRESEFINWLEREERRCSEQ